MKIKLGELVRHRRSERGMLGIVVEIYKNETPVVLWDDGRRQQCTPIFLEVVSESR